MACEMAAKKSSWHVTLPRKIVPIELIYISIAKEIFQRSISIVGEKNVKCAMLGKMPAYAYFHSFFLTSGIGDSRNEIFLP